MSAKRFLWVGLVLGIAPAALQAADFTSWGKQMEITFPGYSGGREALTDFPALIVFRDGSNGVDFTEFEPGGADLRFSDHTRTNALNFEIETWNDAGSNSWIWVQVPELTSNTVIHAFWNKPGAASPVYATNGATWGNGYEAVWHLNEDVEDEATSGVHRDSSPAQYVGSQVGNGPTNGPIAFAQQFDGADRIQCEDILDPGASSWIVECWFRWDSNNGTDNILYCKEDVYETKVKDGYVQYAWKPHWSWDGGSSFPVSLGEWVHCTLQYDKQSQRLYRNGELVYSRAQTGDMGSSPNILQFGQREISNGYPFHGALDELRFSTQVRSDDWIWASWATAAPNRTFAVLSEAESQSWPVVKTLPPANITATTAELNGYLSQTGKSETAVSFFWGTTDGGTNAAQWARETVLPAPQSLGPVSTTVTVVAGHEYYVRCAASNETGRAWAPETEYFLSSPVTVTVSPATVGEAWEAAIFTFSRSPMTTGMPITVNFTPGGTATPGEDYPALDAFSTVIPAGESNATVSVISILDAYPEGDETLVLSLAEGRYAIGSPAQATLTITNTTLALTNTWTGQGDAINWNDAENWSAGTPVSGQDVEIGIGAAVTLSNATPPLASFSLDSGDTLTVAGWDSVIEAHTIAIYGTLTHAANTTNSSVPEIGAWVPEHRVWLKGSNITVAAGGEIDADYLGFPPGGGPGAGEGSGGAAHAGEGRRGFGGSPIASPYDDPAAPVLPGSGGGLASNSRPGGGAIRIEADGDLRIEGDLRARGQNAAGTHGRGSSGGSIWLTCHTLSGAATGTVAVDGGDGNFYGAGGAGGRIAVQYDPVAQAALGEPRPPIHFSCEGGKPAGGDPLPPDMGTLHLPDPLLISGPLDDRRFYYTHLVFPDTTNWTASALTVDDCVLGLPTGFDLDVTGDCILTNGGALHLFAAPTDDPVTQPGTRLSIGGDLRLEADAWIAPYADLDYGAIPRITVGGDLFVAETAGFDADYKGYRFNVGPGTVPNTGGSAGYGGKGGNGYDGRIGGPAYGTVSGTIRAGSGGASTGLGGRGGGAVWLEVSGQAEVRGLMTARGANGIANHGPGGSGGGIYLACQTLQGTETGLFRVDGGRGNYYGSHGGGGRIVIFYDPALQEALPDPHPPLRFSARTYRRDASDREYNFFAEMGTVYLPDTALLADAPEAAVTLENARFWHTRLTIASRPDGWAPAALSISNCVIGFPAGYTLDVGGDLTVSAGGTVPSDVSGDAEGGLHLYAAAADGPYGGALAVGGDLRVRTNAWLHCHTSGTNGAIVRMRVAGDAFIDAGGGIDADYRGYYPVSGNGNGPGAGQGSGGGGYGGIGGGPDGGVAYGLAALPLEPGSPGGWRGRGGSTPTGWGGGAIHLETAGALVLNGTLTANGQRGMYHYGKGGSGGSIFVYARRVSGSGLLSAEGNAAYGNDDHGGGGRIAVWHSKLPVEEVYARIDATNTTKLVYSATLPGFDGELRVASGGPTAGDGTQGFYEVPFPGGSLFILR